jgi:iduronate 2-sulfatase
MNAILRCFGCFVLSLGCIAGTPAAAAEKPNVLLICVDDLKPLLGCYGDATVQSPSIDRLAARGVLFERAFCNQAVCAPSRNALMTGLRPTTLGIYDLETFFRKAAPDAVTLGQHFRQHGYRAEALGKIFHVGHGNHDDAVSWSVPHWSPKGGGYALPENAGRAAKPAAKPKPASPPKGAATECADVPDSTYADGKIADEAIRRLRAAKEKPGEPFFLAVGFLKPHLPFVAPKKYWDLYRREAFKLPALQTPPQGAPAFAPTNWGELRAYSDIPETGPLSDQQKLHLIHGYHAATSYMDAQLGRLLDALDETGFAQNTIVVLWGDHGWHLGDHGMWCKHTNYEQAARIPLIVAAPGVAQAARRNGDAASRNGDAASITSLEGDEKSRELPILAASPFRKTGALVETVDIYPTLCELAGLPAPKGLDGASFAAALRNPEAATKEAVFHAYPRAPRGMGPIVGRAVRTARYRLVEWKKPGAASETAVLELYDYEKDPEETKNLAAERPEVVAQLRKILVIQPEAKPQVGK